MHKLLNTELNVSVKPKQEKVNIGKHSAIEGNIFHDWAFV